MESIVAINSLKCEGRTGGLDKGKGDGEGGGGGKKKVKKMMGGEFVLYVAAVFHKTSL